MERREGERQVDRGAVAIRHDRALPATLTPLLLESVRVPRVYLREDPVLGTKFVVLGHNTIRGAAGASVLNAELLVAEGCV